MVAWIDRVSGIYILTAAKRFAQGPSDRDTNSWRPGLHGVSVTELQVAGLQAQGLGRASSTIPRYNPIRAVAEPI